jgi:hypothetical protein
MQVGTCNLTVPLGADFSQPFTIAGYDLTTFTAKLQIRVSYAASAALLTLTNGAGITLGNGTFQINMTNAQTAALPVGLWVYDLKITSASNVVTRLIQGTVKVTDEVTI